VFIIHLYDMTWKENSTSVNHNSFILGL